MKKNKHLNSLVITVISILCMAIIVIIVNLISILLFDQIPTYIEITTIAVIIQHYVHTLLKDT